MYQFYAGIPVSATMAKQLEGMTFPDPAMAATFLDPATVRSST